MSHTTFSRRGLTGFSPVPPKATKEGCLFIIGFFLVLLFLLFFGSEIFGED
ncbi:hypothetical protein ACXR6G_17300 [Ancylomarina sp. YFZ004]